MINNQSLAELFRLWKNDFLTVSRFAEYLNIDEQDARVLIDMGRKYHNQGANKMNLYKFNCTVWVQGETLAGALKELHDEVDYHFSLDNNLIALESDQGALAEENHNEIEGQP
jgi:glycogen debranching enzyme